MRAGGALARGRAALALQGGGSHGAFTWGVLDAILEEGSLEIGAISGSSAGAMNAVLLAQGFLDAGRAGARRALRDFWEKIANIPTLPGTHEASGASTMQGWLHLTHYLSPYQLNPFDINPLRDILEGCIDFKRLRRSSSMKLFIGATQVASGRLRVFGNSELSLDVLMASACLPTIHRSVEIEGLAYWDGGLSGNPPLLPLVASEQDDDVILVLLQPARAPDTLTGAQAIAARLSEISFGASLASELRTIGWAQRRARESLFGLSRLDRRLRRLRLHAIEAPEFLGRLAGISKVNTHPEFIHSLFEAGVAAARAWYTSRAGGLGSHATFDLAPFLDGF